MQTDDDVGLLRLLVHHLQEVDVADVCGESKVKDLTVTCVRCKPREKTRLAPAAQDTEEVKGAGDVDDGVSGLRLLPRGELDDFLGCLEEL